MYAPGKRPAWLRLMPPSASVVAADATTGEPFGSERVRMILKGRRPPLATFATAGRHLIS